MSTSTVYPLQARQPFANAPPSAGAAHPEASAVSRVAGFFRHHARTSPIVGGKSTRPLRWWADVLSRVFLPPGAPALTANTIRLALGTDARCRVDLAGQTNVKAKATLTHAGHGPGRYRAMPAVQAAGAEVSQEGAVPPEESAGVGGAL